MVGISNTLNVITEIPRRQAVQASVHEHGKLEVDMQPVKVLKHRCDVLVVRYP